jgi:hypothetical protein
MTDFLTQYIGEIVAADSVPVVDITRYEGLINVILFAASLAAGAATIVVKVTSRLRHELRNPEAKDPPVTLRTAIDGIATKQNEIAETMRTIHRESTTTSERLMDAERRVERVVIDQGQKIAELTVQQGKLEGRVLKLEEAKEIDAK